MKSCSRALCLVLSCYFSFSDHHFRAAENYSKNRYADVLAMEETRVVLKSDSNESDYINANYVDGFDHIKAYISTQGPLEKTVKDQWRLLWQQKVRVIVMTTK